jgi:hypothetical protein
MTDYERLKAYDEELSKVMPPDFKDWWQNSKNEWPEIARWVIETQYKEIELLYNTLDKQSEVIKQLEKNQRD